MYQFEKDKYNDSIRKKFSSELVEDCSQSSKNELVAAKCERDTNALKFAEYMEKHIGEEFDVFVSGLTQNGVIVQLPNLVEGFIKLASMKLDFFTYKQETNELIGKSTGIRLSLGSQLHVKLISASKITKKIEFELLKFIKNR